MSWFAAAWPLTVAALTVLVPGIIATVPMRMPVLPRIAIAGPVGVVSLGLAGIGAGALGIRFALWQSLVVALAGALVMWLCTRTTRAGRRRRWDASGIFKPRGWVLWWSWLAASGIVAFVAFWRVPSPELFSQSYDNVFHLSAIAHIMQSGDASSLTLRTLIEPAKAWSLYPSGWHSIVALTATITGASVPVAMNAAWLAVAIALWIPGAAWLTQVLAPHEAAARTALVAMPLAASFGAFPFALLAWGTLYPTFLATAVMPAALALMIVAWRRWREPRAPLAARLVLAKGAAAVAVLAIFFGQPRVLVTFAVLLAPLVGWRLKVAARERWRRGGADRRVVAITALAALVAALVIAAAGFWYLVTRLGLFERPLDDRLGGPQAAAVQSVWLGIVQVLSQSWLVGDGGAATWPALLLAAAVIVGAVSAWRMPRLRWLVASYAVLGILFALAAGSDDVATKLATGLWYKDRYRLSSALPVVGVVLATIGVITVKRWRVSRETPARARHAASATRSSALLAALTAAVALTSAATLAFGGMSQSIGRVFATPPARAVNEIASEAQLDFMRNVGEVVPPGQRVLADPWGGSTLVWMVAGLEPVFPHLNGQWDADRLTLAFALPEIETNPEVCAALDRLRVRYVLYNAHEIGGGDPAGNLFPGPDAAVQAGLFTLVESDGETSLYRIDQCGALPSP